MSNPDYMKIFRGAADLIYPQSAPTERYFRGVVMPTLS
jgi:hypothetical protein